MVILVCWVLSIPLVAMAWRRGWKKKALVPVLCLVIIAAIDTALGSALSDISGFQLIVGIVYVVWLVYMVFKTPKSATLKK